VFDTGKHFLLILGSMACTIAMLSVLCGEGIHVGENAGTNYITKNCGFFVKLLFLKPYKDFVRVKYHN